MADEATLLARITVDPAIFGGMSIHAAGEFLDLFLKIPLTGRPCQKSADDGKAEMGPIAQKLPGFIAHFAVPFLNFDLSPKEKFLQG